MRPFALTTALAALAALALAAPAAAVYDPKLTLGLEPPTAGGALAVTLDIAQAPAEEATRSVFFALPGFGTAPGVRGRTVCTGTAATSGACPAESRLGSVSFTTEFGEFAGGIFLAGLGGDRVNVLAIASNPRVPVVLDQRFTGALSPFPGGRELTFDDLPGATATRLRIALDGGARALLAAPVRCGAHELLGRLTSHGGERSDHLATVAIGGCPGARPVLLGTAFSPRQVRTGATSALTFALSEPASVRITARRPGTRTVRTLRRLAGRAGRNRVTRLGRGLAPGLWVVTVHAADGDGATARTLTLRVLPPRRR